MSSMLQLQTTAVLGQVDHAMKTESFRLSQSRPSEVSRLRIPRLTGSIQKPNSCQPKSAALLFSKVVQKSHACRLGSFLLRTQSSNHRLQVLQNLRRNHTSFLLLLVTWQFQINFFFVVVDIFDFPPCPPAMLMHHLELFDPVPVVLVVKGFRP